MVLRRRPEALRGRKNERNGPDMTGWEYNLAKEARKQILAHIRLGSAWISGLTG